MWQTNIISAVSRPRSIVNLIPIRTLVLTSKCDLNQKWRKERGLPLNPNSHGVLTDAPDYTFVDGRPTPYGLGQRVRILKQKALAEKIIELTSEMDFALNRYNTIQNEEMERRTKMIESKLKPKGQKLLEKQ